MVQRLSARLSLIVAIVVAFLAINISTNSYAQVSEQCLALVKGEISFDVTSCRKAKPIDDFDKDADLEFLKGMIPSDKTKFLQQYTGNLITGKVVFSKAKKVGISDDEGALLGESISIYLRPQQNFACPALNAKRISGLLEEICCSGAGDAPCLLSTQYVLNNLKVVGKPKSEAGDIKRQNAKKSDSYQRGLQFYLKKDYTNAVPLFEQAKKKGELDVAGYYRLGLSYRLLDDCNKAVGPLQTIQDMVEKNKVWGDQNDIVRKAGFLRARCLAKINRPGEAIIILRGYLIEPAKYKPELTASLKHPDFGWINATKEYIQYKKDATAALAKGR